MDDNFGGHGERLGRKKEGSSPRRLLEAMIETVAAEGYAGASVAKVIERAGTSRATFYHYFAGRESCFVAAYRSILAASRTALREAAEGGGATRSLPVVLSAALRGIAAEPAAARLVLVEAQAAPQAVRAEHEASLAALEEEVRRLLGREGHVEGRPGISPAALLGGIGEMVSSRLLRGELATLATLVPAISAWVDSYRQPGGIGCRSEVEWARLGPRFPPLPRFEPKGPPLLPRGRNALPAETAAARRRTRIVDAIIDLTAEKGYAGLTVTDVVAAARVTRRSFYSHFDSKEDAFVAAQRSGFQESLGVCAEAFYAEGPWADRVWVGLRELLRYVAERPEAAHLALVEAPAAGERAMRLAHDSRSAFTVFLEEGHRERATDGPPLPQICSEAITGANFGLLRRQVASGRAERAMNLLPELAYLTLAPFLGPERAGEVIEERSATAC